MDSRHDAIRSSVSGAGATVFRLGADCYVLVFLQSSEALVTDPAERGGGGYLNTNVMC